MNFKMFNEIRHVTQCKFLHANAAQIFAVFAGMPDSNVSRQSRGEFKRGLALEAGVFPSEVGRADLLRVGHYHMRLHFPVVFDILVTVSANAV